MAVVCAGGEACVRLLSYIAGHDCGGRFALAGSMTAAVCTVAAVGRMKIARLKYLQISVDYATIV